jgi:hypothetical protein
VIVNKFGPILAPRSARLEEMRNQFDGSRLRSAATVTPADALCGCCHSHPTRTRPQRVMDPRVPTTARRAGNVPPAGRSSFCNWNIFGYSADTVAAYFINIV